MFDKSNLLGMRFHPWNPAPTPLFLHHKENAQNYGNSHKNYASLAH